MVLDCSITLSIWYLNSNWQFKYQFKSKFKRQCSYSSQSQTQIKSCSGTWRQFSSTNWSNWQVTWTAKSYTIKPNSTWILIKIQGNLFKITTYQFLNCSYNWRIFQTQMETIPYKIYKLYKILTLFSDSFFQTFITKCCQNFEIPLKKVLPCIKLEPTTFA